MNFCIEKGEKGENGEDDALLCDRNQAPLVTYGL
jgi:hypothetical protein